MFQSTRTLRAYLVLSVALGVPALGLGQDALQEGQKGMEGLEVVTVTARKRVEPLQDVPIAATAFSTADMDRLAKSNLEGLDLAIPNVTIVRNNSTSNAAQVYIRGIGRDNSTWNEESGVAVYVDDVYFSQQVGSLLDFIEYERVEVLRGPQGTLYGRNATGGAVKFIVKRPEFNSMSAVGDVTFGSFNRLDVRGSVGGEVVDDKLAVKVDFISRTDDGYIRRPASSLMGPNDRLNGINRQTGRVAALYNISDRTEIYFAGDVSFGRSDINTATAVWDPDGDGSFTPRYGDNFITDPGIVNDTRSEAYTLNGQVSTEIGELALKSITAFRSVDDTLNGDLDGSTVFPIDFNQRFKFETFTQEFQFNGKVGQRIEYVAGLYYLSETLSADALNVFLGNLRTLSAQDTTSMAAYLDMTANLSDRWSISAGGRYTHDEKDVTQSAIASSGAPVFTDADGSHSWSEFSPRVALDFKVSPEVLVYGSWSNGFKAGAVVNGRPTSAAVANIFTEPETATTTEVGLKSQWLGNRLRINIAAFDTDYENLQSSFQEPNGGAIRLVTADVKLKGVDLEAVARLADPLTLFLVGGWLDSKYANVQPGHPAFGIEDRIRMKMVPESSIRVGLEYRTELPGGKADLVLGANFLNSAKIPRNLTNTPMATTPAFETIAAQVAIESVDKRWRVALSGENLDGEEYWTMAQPPFSRFFVPERTWALTMRYATR